MDYHYDTVCFPSEWFENDTKKEETKEMDYQASVDLIGWNWSQNFTCNLLVTICIPQYGPGENSENDEKACKLLRTYCRNHDKWNEEPIMAKNLSFVTTVTAIFSPNSSDK